MKKNFFFLLALFFSAQMLFGQTTEQRSFLRNFSVEAEKTWKANRAVAESIAVKNNMPIRKELPNGGLMELQSIENGIPVYYATDNKNAAATVSTNKLWAGNQGGYSLSGKNQLIGIWDGGSIRLTHQEFAGRVTQIDNPSALSDHSNHVTGTMIATGVDANAKGMASDATEIAYDYNNDLSEISSASANGLRLSNHSYGQITGWQSNYRNDNRWAWFGDTTISATEDYKFGLYTSGSAQLDNVLYNAPYYVMCRAAGNDRGEGPEPGTEHWLISGGQWALATTTHEKDGGANGYGCLEFRAVCKNVITVAAVNPIVNGYKQPSDVVMTSFSDWGPTDDGRIKPDISADGVNLYSSVSTADNAYGTMSGTSMATPNTTGSIALIMEQQNNLHPDTLLFAASLKGLVIHTADEAGNAPGPDYSFGWGLLNTWKAVNLLTLNAQCPNSPLIRELTLANGNSYQSQVTSTGKEPLKVTICWTDLAGNPPVPSLNPPDLMLINDLDLRVVGPNGVTYMPWILDPANPSKAATTGDNFRDNVEQVYIDAPVAGTYTIKVTHKNTLISNAQNYSMIISGISLPKPEAPQLINPVDGSSDQSYDMNFNWKLSAKSTSYQVQVAKDSLFNNVVANDSLVAGVFDQTTALPGMTKLFWRVRGLNNTYAGDWSVVRSFTTKLSMPLAPALYTPENNSVKVALNNVTLKWGKSAYATTYNLKINAGPISFLNVQNLTDTTYVISKALTDGKKYTWTVSGTNSTGTSVAAASYSFITLLLAPDSLKTVSITPKSVTLAWLDRSAQESQYVILRKKASDSQYSKIDSIAANSTTYTDTSLANGSSYSYKVYCTNAVAVSDSSNSINITATGVNTNSSVVPAVYSLSQNYPNPFNPRTTIKYSLPNDSNIKLVVVNLLGQVVKELTSGIQNAGYHEVEFDGSNCASGIYFYSIHAKSLDGKKEFTDVKKLILMK
mgnify:CR=1 FL=1